MSPTRSLIEWTSCCFGAAAHFARKSFSVTRGDDALVDAVTALGASELIALKWKNRRVGSRNPSVRICIGRRRIEELKETKSRNNPLPLAESVLQVLRL